MKNGIEMWEKSFEKEREDQVGANMEHELGELFSLLAQALALSNIRRC